MHPLVRLWHYADRRRKDIVLAALFSVLKKLFDIAPEILIGVLVDTVVKREQSFLAGLGAVNVEHQLILLAGLTVVIWRLAPIRRRSLDKCARLSSALTYAFAAVAGSAWFPVRRAAWSASAFNLMDAMRGRKIWWDVQQQLT